MRPERQIFPAGAAEDARHLGPAPDDAVREAASHTGRAAERRVPYPATVQVLEFSGLRRGGAEWPAEGRAEGSARGGAAQAEERGVGSATSVKPPPKQQLG